MSLSASTPAAAAQDILKKYSITSAPVPVEEIARHLGALVKYSALDDELSGMITIHNGLPIIGVNSLHHPHRQRFTIAHELGHLVMHRSVLTEKVHVDKKFKVLMRDANASTGKEKLEIEANRFAAELLIPTEMLKAMWTKHYDIEDESPSEGLAKKFKVSKLMFEYRIMNLDERW